MSRQTDSAKLIAIGLLNLADDEGYFYADPKMVRNSLRPMDDDSGITTVSLRELSEIGFISIKTHPTHGQIGFIESFLHHQVINKPKRSNIKDLFNSGIDTVSIPESDGLERKGKEGKGREGNLCPQADVLAEIWNICPSLGKSRSSKKQVADTWKSIPARDRPSGDVLLSSFEKWIQSQDWAKENGQYVPALHLWFKNRKWEVDPMPMTETRHDRRDMDGFGV